MTEADAINRITDLYSIDALNERIAGASADSALIAPETLKTIDLQKYMPHLRRLQAHMRTVEIASYVAYCASMADQVNNSLYKGLSFPVFVEPDDMSALAVFDLGTVAEPLHQDNKATLTLKSTAEYREFLRRNGEKASQRKFAEWLEEWRDCLTLFDAEGNELPFTVVVAAVRKFEISAKAESGSEIQSYSSRKTAMTEVAAKDKDKLPAYIDFTCRPYKELTERRLRMRVSVITSEEPVFTLKAMQFETVQEEIAAEFCGLLSEQLAGIEAGHFHVLVGSI